jgi:hypothetical protein
MSPFEYARIAKHPYQESSEDTYGHFAPTALRHPAYSAACVPFAWTLREAMEELGAEYSLDVQAERESKLAFDTS